MIFIHVADADFIKAYQENEKLQYLILPTNLSLSVSIRISGLKTKCNNLNTGLWQQCVENILIWHVCCSYKLVLCRYLMSRFYNQYGWLTYIHTHRHMHNNHALSQCVSCAIKSKSYYQNYYDMIILCSCCVRIPIWSTFLRDLTEICSLSLAKNIPKI